MEKEGIDMIWPFYGGWKGGKGFRMYRYWQVRFCFPVMGHVGIYTEMSMELMTLCFRRNIDPATSRIKESRWTFSQLLACWCRPLCSEVRWKSGKMSRFFVTI